MSTRVMIIDDDENTLKLMRVLLEAKGFQVRTYRQPEAAFAALDSFEPTVIVINWLYCGKERGSRLLYQIRGQMLTAMTPVVVVSGAIHQLQGIRD
jgi:DNA-binding response OmpR family regulator